MRSPVACAVAACTLAAGAPGAGRGTDLKTTGKPRLPPLLRFEDGRPVRTRKDLAERQAEIRALMTRHYIGRFPAKTPGLLAARVTARTHPADGSTRQRVRLTFDTPNRIGFEIRVWTPKRRGPHPVLLLAPRAYQLPWAHDALKRGYLVCLYPGVEHMAPDDEFGEYKRVWQRFRREYPGATWTELSGKAWLASRALDYVLGPESGLDTVDGQVAIIGHSRYGKQSLIAAAFDPRITAVVARSPGSPASCPYRFTSRETFAETPADFPDPWFLKSLHGYDGREHELPGDAHYWYALIAPRPCLIHTAHHDGCEPTFAVEQAYLEGRRIYRFLKKPRNLRVLYRTGQHNPTTAQHRRQNLDWFDLAFERGKAASSSFPEELIHQFDWKAWRKGLSKNDRTPPPASQGVRSRILWTLGRSPANIEWDGQYTFLSAGESKMMTHDRWAIPNTERIPASFGENVRGNVYYNPRVKKPAPAVIWLHPYSYHSGYNEGYGVQKTTIYHRLARAGYVVLCFDQCGFGLRLLEGRNFYGQYPKWSRLGRMVHDVHAAVDFLVDGEGQAKRRLPAIRKDRIFLLGYALGGMTGLYAAALDERVAGVACFSGFTPLRTNTDNKVTGGNRRWWELHALQPLLGLYHGREAEIPYDFDDVLSLIAPRQCLLVAPTRDRFADHDEVVACVNRAKNAWRQAGRTENLTLAVPNDISRFQTAQQDRFLEWLWGVRR